MAIPFGCSCHANAFAAVFVMKTPGVCMMQTAKGVCMTHIPCPPLITGPKQASRLTIIRSFGTNTRGRAREGVKIRFRCVGGALGRNEVCMT